MWTLFNSGLTEKDIDLIAEKAAEKAIQKMTVYVYQEVGKSIVNRFFLVVGVLFVSFITWLHSKGGLPF